MLLDRTILAALWLAALPTIGAAGAMTTPQRPHRTLPDCWVEHTQVQPSALTDGAREAATGDQSIQLLSDRHLGAEHPGDRRTRPCGVLSPRKSVGGSKPRKTP